MPVHSSLAELLPPPSLMPPLIWRDVGWLLKCPHMDLLLKCPHMDLKNLIFCQVKGKPSAASVELAFSCHLEVRVPLNCEPRKKWEWKHDWFSLFLSWKSHLNVRSATGFYLALRKTKTFALSQMQSLKDCLLLKHHSIWKVWKWLELS